MKTTRMANLFAALTSPIWVAVFIVVYLGGCAALWLASRFFPPETDHD